MARPKKSQYEKRSATVKTNLTEAEKAYVQQQAETAQLSEAEYTRIRVLKRPIRSTQEAGNARLIMELNRAGIALKSVGTQLAAMRNQHLPVPSNSSSFDELISQHRTVLQKMHKALDDLLRS